MNSDQHFVEDVYLATVRVLLLNPEEWSLAEFYMLYVPEARWRQLRQ